MEKTMTGKNRSGTVSVLIAFVLALAFSACAGTENTAGNRVPADVRPVRYTQLIPKRFR